MFAVGAAPVTSAVAISWRPVMERNPFADGRRGDGAWHLGLVGANQGATVLADNIPGQPYVLVRRDGTWYQPSASGTFGRPLSTAVPTSLIDDNELLS